MLAIITVQTGPSQGHKLVLREGQEMQFGRTEWADAVFPDEKMSKVHFEVQAKEGQLMLRDLDSLNGTLVNGQYVKEAELHKGDEIVAGDTHFFVSLRGAPAASEKATAEDNAPFPKPTIKLVRDTTRLPPKMAKTQIPYNLNRCESGLVLLTGGELGQPGQPEAPSEVAARLAYRWPQYLIVDFQKAELEIPEGLGKPLALFDWVPEEFAVQSSPLVVPPLPDVDVAALIDGAWDKDAVICLYTDRDADSLVSHLRAATRFNIHGRPRGNGEPKSMLGYCWPGVLAQLLAFRDGQFVEALLEGIEAAFCEVPDLPGTWQVFARSSLTQQLDSLKFEHAEPEPEPTAEEGAGQSAEPS